MNRTKIFISYSHQDAPWLERLQVHLKPLEREGLIERWDDTRIMPGEKWQEEIGKALACAKVAVLLVSADFMASEFIANDELPPLLAASEVEGAVIVPVILSPSRFEKTPLARFQSVNPPSQPLISLSKVEQEAVFVRVAEAVEKTLSTQDISPLKQSTDFGHGSASLSTNRSFIGQWSVSLHGIFTWIIQNKEWVFSGIGVAIATLIIGWLFASSEPSPQLPSNVKANRSVVTGGKIEGSQITIIGSDRGKRPEDTTETK